MSSIRDLKDQIANHVLELNDLKEKNTRDLKAVNELKQLMKDLQEGVDCWENEFTTNCLDKFDEIMNKELSDSNESANEIYKSIASLLKKAEKDYDFNAIDPIDEDRDHIELKHKLLSLEKAKHEKKLLLAEEDNLSEDEKSKLDQIENIKSLSEIKALEDKVILLLKKNSVPIEEHIPSLDQETHEVSDSYFKKSIIKARGRLIERQRELLDKEHELNSKTNDFYSNNLSQLETKIKHKSKEQS